MIFWGMLWVFCNYLFFSYFIPLLNYKFPFRHLSSYPGHTPNGLPVHLPIFIEAITGQLVQFTEAIPIEEIPGLPVHLLHRASKAPGHKTTKLEFKPDHFIEAEAAHIDSKRNPQLLLKDRAISCHQGSFQYTTIIEAILIEAIHVESLQVLIITFISQLVPFHISEGWLGSNKEQIEDTFLSTQAYHFIASCRLLPLHFHFWLPITNFFDISSSEAKGWHIHPWSDKSSPCAIYCDSDLPFYFSYFYPTKNKLVFTRFPIHRRSSSFTSKCKQGAEFAPFLCQWRANRCCLPGTNVCSLFTIPIPVH